VYLGSLGDSAGSGGGIIGGVVAGSLVFVSLLVLLLVGLYFVKQRFTKKIYYPMDLYDNDG